MVLIRGLYCVVFAILLGIRGSEGNRKTLEVFIRNKHGLAAPDMDENMAGLAWVHCRQVIDSKYAPREEEAGSDSNSSSLRKESMHKAMPHNTRLQLLDCLRDKNLVFSTSNGWLEKYIEQLSPRRYLVTLSQSVTRTRPSKSPIQSVAAYPVSEVQAPAEAPRNLRNRNRNGSAPPPEVDVFLPIDMFESPPPPPPRHKHSYWSPPPPPPPPSSDESQARRLAFVGTVVGMCLIIASVMFCCLRGGGGRAVDGQRDEKPLLALSSSNYSGGSSRSNSLMFRSSSNSVFNNRSQKLGSLLSLKSGKQEQSVAPPQIPELKPPPGTEAPVPPAPPSSPGAPPPPPSPAPPPPPKVVRPPPAPPPKAIPGKPNAPKPQRKASQDDDAESGSQKAKLKPFFWDKTVLTNTDQSMVWNEIRSGSFQFNEEMIETLFGYTNVEKNKSDRKKDSSGSEPVQYIQIIDTKKAQNLGILLRALNVTTEEVVDALREGNELPVDLLATLLKVAPTTEEELKLRLFTGELTQLGPAERFLKILVDIPYAFKRLDSLLFMCSFQEESSSVEESLANLEVACNKLRSSRLFLKLLEAVLKTGNRMNDGTYRGGAQAFRLDTLLKLADVKGTDGKTTLLHFVVTEIIRSEGAKALRNAKASSMSSVRTEDLTDEISEVGTEEHRSSLGLEVVSALSDELEDVKKAAAVDADALTSTISRMGHSLLKTRNFLTAEMSNVNEESEFFPILTSFVKQAEVDVTRLLEEEKRIMALVKSTTDYFHGSTGKDEGLRLFVIVRDFLIMVDKVCREVKNSASKPTKNSNSNSNSKREAPNVLVSSENLQSLSDVRQRLFPAIAGRRVEDSSSSSDEES